MRSSADALRTGRLSSDTCACQCLHGGATHRRLVPGHDDPGRFGAVHARQVVQQPAQLLRADGGPATPRRTQPEPGAPPLSGAPHKLALSEAQVLRHCDRQGPSWQSGRVAIAKQIAQLLCAGYRPGRRAQCPIESLMEARRPRIKAACSGPKASGMLQTLNPAPGLGSCSSGHDHR